MLELERLWSKNEPPRKNSGGSTSLSIVTTTSYGTLKTSSPTTEKDNAESPGKEVRRGLRRLSSFSRWQSRRKSSKDSQEAIQAGEKDHETNRANQEREHRRSLAVQNGTYFLQDFVRYHFENHIDSIRIINTHTLTEIKMIANEDSSVGIRQCRRLFNVPVISDEIGRLLYEELKQGSSLDHNHENSHEAEEQKEHTEPPAPKERRGSIFAERFKVILGAMDPHRNHSASNSDSELPRSREAVRPFLREEYTWNKQATITENVKEATQQAMNQPRSMRTNSVGSMLGGIKARAARGFLCGGEPLANRQAVAA